MLWCEVEKVDVDVALDCNGCAWVFRENFSDSYLEVLCEVRVVMWPSVDVNDGVGRICLSFSLVNLKGDGCCLWDGDIEDGDVEGIFVVGCHAVYVFMIVSFNGVAVLVDVCW